LPSHEEEELEELEKKLSYEQLIEYVLVAQDFENFLLICFAKWPDD